MQSKFWFFKIFILVVFTSVACKNSKLSRLSKLEGAFVGRVEVSAGDDIDYQRGDTLNFMTFPMNVLSLEDDRRGSKRIYLIGKSMAKNTQVAFLPVALMDVNRNGIEEQIVIAKPMDENLQTADINTFFELISVHYGIQKMIETWETNVYGFGSKVEISWENEEKAVSYLKGI